MPSTRPGLQCNGQRRRLPKLKYREISLKEISSAFPNYWSSRLIMRDPITLGAAVFLPLVMLFIFGYAISLDVEDISMAVFDQDRSQQSSSFLEKFTSSGYFLRKHDLNSFQEIDKVLDRGDAALVVVIPPDFSREILAGRTAQVQIILDGTFTATALIISNYAAAIVNGTLSNWARRPSYAGGFPRRAPFRSCRGSGITRP
jgi:ABC-2 type transport system permease protein